MRLKDCCRENNQRYALDIHVKILLMARVLFLHFFFQMLFDDENGTRGVFDHSFGDAADERAS